MLINVLCLQEEDEIPSLFCSLRHGLPFISTVEKGEINFQCLNLTRDMMMYFTYHNLKVNTDQIAYPNRVGGGSIFNAEI